MGDLRERCERYLEDMGGTLDTDDLLSFAREMQIEGMEKAQAAIRDHITELRNADDTKVITRQVQAEEGFRCIAVIDAEIQRERDGNGRS